jgi:3-dehydroquinate dehydratase/shikimate dehydrogenase
MGGFGLVSRALGPKFGAPLVYAGLTPSGEAAPGQPDAETLVKTYRIHETGPDTTVFGLAGHPLGHSLSPAFHNEAFRERGLDAVYLPFDAEDFDVLWRARDLLDLRGLSVTLPHKVPALAVADEVSQTAREAGAANLLAKRGERWFVDNTDVPAVGEALAEAGIEIAGREALVLGAGGAARAACLALKRLRARIAISARSPERAERLARAFEASTADWPPADLSPFYLIINATPVGMRPATGAAPIDPSRLSRDHAVFDMVYNPEETLLLREAKRRGCTTVSGLSMFLAQARGQQERWK